MSLFNIKIDHWNNDEIVLRFFSESRVTIKIHGIALYKGSYVYNHSMAYPIMVLDNSYKLIHIIPFEQHDYKKITFTCEYDNGKHNDIQLSYDNQSIISI